MNFTVDPDDVIVESWPFYCWFPDHAGHDSRWWSVTDRAGNVLCADSECGFLIRDRLMPELRHSCSLTGMVLARIAAGD